MATKKPDTDKTARQYHVTLPDGERTITAADVQVQHNGALEFVNATGDTKVAYAAGQWRTFELETQDE